MVSLGASPVTASTGNRRELPPCGAFRDFGQLRFSEALVNSLDGKGETPDAGVNGGFMVLNKRILDIVPSDEDKLDVDVLKWPAEAREPGLPRRVGLSKYMHTPRAAEIPNRFWDTGNPPSCVRTAPATETVFAQIAGGC
ncbi:MAG: rfbF [Bryobacterales bacterium]|nr:rfbF [Bryobacterales bacterium]